MTGASYVRLFADASGESHFSSEEAALASIRFAPPAPPLNLSAFAPATRFALLGFPAGWSGGWHPAPHRQVFSVLAGEIDCAASDGEIRRFGPGSVLLLEDTMGKGHTARSVGGDTLAAVVQLGNRDTGQPALM